MHIKTRNCFVVVGVIVAAAAFALAAAPARAALNWEGQSGVFMNALAFTLGANKTEAGYHFIDLDSVGNIHTASVTHGLGGKAEVGYTRVFTDVPGVNDQNIVHAKYQFLPETKDTPAAAVWVLHRDLVGAGSTTDYGVLASKVLSVIKDHPVIVSLGARSTKSLAQGLYGIGDREMRFDGLVAVFVTQNLIVGGEFRQQVGSEAWGDIAARYIVNKNLNVDVGLANFGKGFRNQLALGATWAF